jgi:phage terminase small subunit
MPRSLNPQQRAFCLEYVKTSNATRAAESAGYSAATAAVQGCQLLKKPLIATEIARLRRPAEKRAELTAQRLYEEVAKIAFSNVQELYDDQNNLKPISELPPEVAAIISQIEDTGKGGKKLKLHSKVAALEIAGKLLGVLRQEPANQQAVQIIIGNPPAIQEPAAERQPILPVWDDGNA